MKASNIGTQPDSSKEKNNPEIFIWTVSQRTQSVNSEIRASSQRPTLGSMINGQYSIGRLSGIHVLEKLLVIFCLYDLLSHELHAFNRVLVSKILSEQPGP